MISRGTPLSNLDSRAISLEPLMGGVEQGWNQNGSEARESVRRA